MNPFNLCCDVPLGFENHLIVKDRQLSASSSMTSSLERNALGSSRSTTEASPIS
ncbi:hypothetical protein DPMN_190942 [Dreissena polymorpha]|uniref:Uncharacterized protein n=1 Tax=Dreissena polymorpha TaxID=45954 RepID=A0A9D4B702_DREPO|nr:hypothetical protein DPMN_190942 [Dreissena polymorpha]